MKTLFTLLCIVITLNAYTQTNTFPSSGSAGIGTTSPNASSIIEMTSISQGILVPRMTLSQRNAISGPATGLLIYQTDSGPGFYFYNGSTWTVIYSGAALNQNLLPDGDNTRSLGSTAYSWNSMYADGAFYLNGNRFLAQSTTDNNTFVGSNAGISNTSSSGVKNTFVGYESGYYTTESHNTGVGYRALYANTEGYNNTAVGVRALTSNTTGYTNTAMGSSAMYYNTTGYNNAAVGMAALWSNTTGHENTAMGADALESNTTGNNNAAFGSEALWSATTGNNNTALGTVTLKYNTTGYYNTASGTGALYSNTTGYSNVAGGTYSMFSSTTGNSNTALGYYTMYNNTIGTGNTAVGKNAGSYNDATTYCTFLGYDADQGSSTDYDNSTAIGNGSRITGNNQVRIGNSSVTSIGGYASWTNISDGRFKSDIKADVPGLEFINLLQPVTYHLDVNGIHKFLKEGDETGISAAQKEMVTFTGFIAQDVEAAAKEIGYDFSGVDVPQNENSLYGLRYAEFTVPLVKAVQQLSDITYDQWSENIELEERIEKLELLITGNDNTEKITQYVKLQPANTSTRLDQNMPNPFNDKTVIGYFVPGNVTSAQLRVTSENGTELMIVDIKKGEGRIELDASLLHAGNYFYSLVVEGTVVNTKQLFITK